jgi:hypothetical protein
LKFSLGVTHGVRFGRISCIALILAAIFWFILLESAYAIPPDVFYGDFGVSSPSAIPSPPSAGDLVVFYAQVQVDTNIHRYIGWVNVSCFVDGDLWEKQEWMVSRSETTEIHTETPWRATLGQHIVTWVVEDDFLSELGSHWWIPGDPTSNNRVEYSFLVGEKSGEFDFGMSASPGWQSVRIGESIKFQINVYMSPSTTQRVYLSIHAPPEIVTSVRPESGSSSFSSELTLNCGHVSTGAYFVTVNATGLTRSHSLKLALLAQPVFRRNSSVVISISPVSPTLGSNLTISGAIQPPCSTALALVYTRPEGLTFMTNLTSKSDGRFLYTLSLTTPGAWKFYVTCRGDAEYLEAQSASVTVEVKEIRPPPYALLLKQFELVPMGTINALALVLLIALMMSLCWGIVVVGFYERNLEPQLQAENE